MYGPNQADLQNRCFLQADFYCSIFRVMKTCAVHAKSSMTLNRPRSTESYAKDGSEELFTKMHCVQIRNRERIYRDSL